MSVEVTKKRPKEFKKTRYCKRTQAGNVTEFVEMSSRPSAPPIKKLSSTEYLNLLTGEVLEFEQSETRADNVDSLRKSFKALRLLINANVTDNKNIHWVTLTYAENMQDTETLYADFKKFWQKFKRFCKKMNLTPPEYIAAIEPQARGAWHVHCIFIWNRKRPFIDNNTVFAPMWGHGFTKIQGVPEDCDNLGAYLSAYLSDMAVTEDSDQKGKKYVKGARLALYPVGVNIFRHSRNIKKPVVSEVCPDQVKKEKASAGTLTFSCSYVITDQDDNKRYITKEYYNSKRGKSQGKAAKKVNPVETLLAAARALGIKLTPIGATEEHAESIPPALGAGCSAPSVRPHGLFAANSPSGLELT